MAFTPHPGLCGQCVPGTKSSTFGQLDAVLGAGGGQRFRAYVKSMAARHTVSFQLLPPEVSDSRRGMLLQEAAASEDAFRQREASFRRMEREAGKRLTAARFAERVPRSGSLPVHSLRRQLHAAQIALRSSQQRMEP
jgi:hypothetical protein